MDWKKIFETVSVTADTIINHVSFRSVVVGDRETALAQILDKVEHSTKEQIDAYEIEFLNNAAALINPRERIRAMELYAAFKLAETGRFGEFQGFAFRGERLG